MSQQIERTTYRTPAVAAPTDQRMSVAERQFRLNLERQAAEEAEDRRNIARHKARQPAIAASIAREKRILVGAALVCIGLALLVASAVVYVLMTMGVPLLFALLAALLLGPATGGGCCIVTVTVIHGH